MNDRLFRALLRCYPRDIRERFGGEMVELWRWRWSRARGRPFSFWISALFETLRVAPLAHLTEWVERRRWLSVPPAVRRRWGVIRGMANPEPRLRAVVRTVHDGLRSLRRSPRFTFTATLLFAVGIGANTLVFGLLYTVVGGRMPYREPDRLVAVHRASPDQDVSWMPISTGDLSALGNRTDVLSGVAGAWYTTFTLTPEGAPTVLNGAAVTADFTEVLGVRPLVGRGFRTDDGAPGAERVVLVGETVWRERYGSDPGVVGRVITSGGAPARVVGVMPAGFRLPGASSMWEVAREGADPLLEDQFFLAVGRLAPGVSLSQASARLKTFVLKDSRRFAGIDAEGIRLQSLRSWVFAGASRPVSVLYGLMTLVLLLACLNVAGLLLARNETRRRELAIRVSVGAGRLGVACQLLAEGLLLAGAGGVVGAVLGWQGRNLALRLLPGPVSAPLLFGVRPAEALAITGIIAFTGLLASLPPTLSLVRSDLREAFHAGGGSLSLWRRGSRLRSFLLTTQVALAVPILAGAGLTLRSELARRSWNPGFRAESIATAQVSLVGVPVRDAAERSALHQRVLEKVRRVPGVRGAAFTASLPTGSATRGLTVWRDEADGGTSGPRVTVASTDCGAAYFATLGIPLVGGREFDAGDGLEGARDVAIVNAALDNALWPGKKPLGGRIVTLEGPDQEPRSREVVGVVGDVPDIGFFVSPAPQVYLPWEASGRQVSFLLVGTSGAPETVLEEVRAAIREVDQNIAVTDLSTLKREIVKANWEAPVFFRAFGLMALIALVLAAAGVYGIIAFSMHVQMREIALRVALGGDPHALRRKVMRKGVLLALVGLVAGGVLSAATLPLVHGFLVGQSSTGPGVYVLAVGVLAGIVALAGYLPARRATSLDPVRILNSD